jgi:hypothetical protein
MDIFEVTTEVSTLGECLLTLWTSKGSLTSVLTEMVS